MCKPGSISTAVIQARAVEHVLYCSRLVRNMRNRSLRTHWCERQYVQGVNICRISSSEPVPACLAPLLPSFDARHRIKSTPTSLRYVSEGYSHLMQVICSLRRLRRAVQEPADHRDTHVSERVYDITPHDGPSRRYSLSTRPPWKVRADFVQSRQEAPAVRHVANDGLPDRVRVVLRAVAENTRTSIQRHTLCQGEIGKH